MQLDLNPISCLEMKKFYPLLLQPIDSCSVEIIEYLYDSSMAKERTKDVINTYIIVVISSIIYVYYYFNFVKNNEYKKGYLKRERDI